jgi:hypothetical protein
VRVLAREGFAIEQLARSGPPDVLSEMADHVARGGKQGIFVTDRPAAALCLANRSRGVRAVSGATWPAVEAALRAVGGNVLVLEPGRASRHELQLAALRFLRDAPWPCPPELAPYLT